MATSIGHAVHDPADLRRRRQELAELAALAEAARELLLDLDRPDRPI